MADARLSGDDPDDGVGGFAAFFCSSTTLRSTGCLPIRSGRAIWAGTATQLIEARLDELADTLPHGRLAWSAKALATAGAGLTAMLGSRRAPAAHRRRDGARRCDP